MKTAEDWIRQLNLKPHPEGGFYVQTDMSIAPYLRNEKSLPLYTNIYFLLTADSPSHFHKLSSDEMWFYHAGNPLTVHSLKQGGAYQKVTLSLKDTDCLHYTVPAGDIFGSTVDEGYALVSCTVVPGFDFEDFKLFTKQELLCTHPKHAHIINELAYDRLPK